MKDIHQILKAYWGYSRFRPLQEDIINSILSNTDTLALLPTGGGKSICFQVPAMAMEGLCLVITPLIALMKDQVEQLKKRDIPAVSVNSGMTSREIDIALDNCVYGNIKFLYLSPERLKTDIFKERLKKMKVSLIAVDEAHCISQWGYDFRPSYLTISDIREQLKDIPIIALTATATEEVKKDIQEKLLFKKASKVFQKSYARSNLSYSCFCEEDKERKMLEILSNVKGSSIVYVRSRKKTQELSVLLNRKRISANFYHAGLSHADRAAKQDSWIKGDIRVMVATNAFGMGIDKPDVRTVVHWEMPDSLEAYYQEAGRAGRDEQKSYAVLLYDINDVEIIKERLKESYPAIDFIKKVYQSLANYFKIAVGSSNMASYEFDAEDFERVYSLPKIETYYALKRLETEGFIHIGEALYSSSKIFISMNHKSLYEFQIANEKYDVFVKTILRMYGGELFTDFVNIKEKDIARNLNTTVSKVVESLRTLDRLSILNYSQFSDKPKLTFTTPRLDATSLPIDAKSIEERKNNDTKKVNAVVRYAQQIERCRTQVLLDYFGEVSEEVCGVCDICLKNKRENNKNEKYPIYKTKILESLKDHSMTIDELITIIDKSGKDVMIEIVRSMLDAGELYYDKNQKLSLK